ncbi:MAG TPA: hypothetical protein ENK62_05145 [Chromatiales bacterium]|nr:hypothetical protein [Chromatiales bacterium]
MIEPGRKALVALALLAFTWMLAGCLPDKKDPNAPAFQVFLGMVDATGKPSTVVRAGAPLTATATVFDQDGNPVKGVVVSFTATVARVEPPTALTDSNGKARVQLLYQEEGGGGGGEQPPAQPQALLSGAGLLGGDKLVASVTDPAGNTIQAEKGYEVRPPDFAMGSPGPNGFQEGVLEVSSDTVSAGESITVTAYLVHAGDKTPVNAPLFVNFSSACADIGQAQIDPSVQLDGAGRAIAKYTAGCTGTDTILATLNFGGGTFTATANVAVQSSSVERIEFLGIDDGDGNGFELAPGFMAIRGLGHRANAPEFVKVKFRVTDAFGNPAPNRRVEFDLTTAVGGIQVNPAQDFTNASGEVEVMVQTGSVSAETRVVASTINSQGQSRSALSDTIFVSLFVADADSFSLSQDGFNVEAGSFDGTEVEFTVRAADMNNHAVRPGTVIAFRASHGRIEPSCTTTDDTGTCTVTWTSQDPRPESGLVAILAYVEGVESFSDENGNGVFDAGEPYWNLPEAWVDTNFNGTRDVGEPYVDFNVDGRWNDGVGDGGTETEYAKYNGLLVSDKAFGLLGVPGDIPLASSQLRTINLLEQSMVIASSSTAEITASPASPNVSTPLATDDPDQATGSNASCGSDDIVGPANPGDPAPVVPTPLDCAITMTVTATDINGLPLPQGTTITATGTGGFTLQGTTSVTVPEIRNPAAGAVTMSFKIVDSQPGQDDPGTVEVKAVTPLGVETTASFDVDA